MKILLLLLMTCGALFAAEAPEMRKQAEKLEKEGNWKEAYELRVKLLREVNDKQSGQDLQQAVNSLQRLRQLEKFDPLLDEMTDLKKDNPDFMVAAGVSYISAQHYGQLLDGEFQRGNSGSGEWRNVQEQDRLRALQCYMQAWEVVEKGGAEEVLVLRRLGDALSQNRTGPFLWRFYLLTDLSAKPDYTVQDDQITSTGAPVNDDGEPEYLGMPDSWEKADSDGARWRWLLGEIGRISKGDGLKEEMKWWRFCHQHYGVNTMASYGWWSQPDVEEQEGILQTATLKEAETIAKLANGVSRFTLIEDYRFIPGLRELMRGGKASPAADAGDLLVQVFLNRRQYVKAAETLQEVIHLHGKGNGESRSKLLNQIRGNWSRFDMTPTYFPAEPVEVPFTFRNAEEVKLTLTAVKEDLVLKDIIKYLESNPKQIDYQKVNFEQLGSRLLNADSERYLGEQIRSWTEELAPAEGHQDTRTNLDLGKLSPGCYFLKSSVDGGNTAWIVIWVRDIVLLQHGEGEEEVFYLVDAKAGKPVEGELEFFGYRVDHLQKREGDRRFNVITKKFRKKTDDKGRVALEKDEDWNRMNFQVTARSGKRLAYLGNARFNWRNHGGYQNYHTNKTIGITDRPVYRPGQTVHLKLWAGEARYDLEEVSAYAGKSANVEIRDGRNEVVFEKEGLVADGFGGITFDFDLEESAALGNYNVNVRGEVPNSHFTFRVEEYKKPEFEVSVEAPKEPVALGESFEATVSAKYYHGAPVTEATVKIKVERNFHDDRWFPAGEWDWLYGPGYWWFHPEYPWYPGWARWGCIPPSPPWWGQGRQGAPELVLEQTGPIGADGKVKVEIDSSIAKLVHGDQDHRYSITAEVVDASRRTIVGNGSVLAAREPYEVTVWLDRGYARTGDKVTGNFAARTLDGKEVEGKATAILYEVSLDEEGEIIEKKVGDWKPEGDSWTFVASKTGQYRVAVEFTDTKGRKQEGAAVFSIIGEEDEVDGNFRYNDLELIADKKEYRPGDTVELLVNVNQRNSRVWLHIRTTGGEKSETKIIRVKGKSSVVKIPVALGDMPNFFIEGFTVANGQIHSVTREIVLPPEKRKLNVEVIPTKNKLRPREKTTFKVKITDSKGKPYQGSAAISVYDKSLEYISGGSNVGEIVPFFWDWKRHFHGSSFVHSQNLHGNHLQKPKTEMMRQLGIFGGMGWGGGGRHVRTNTVGMERARMAKGGMLMEESAMMDSFAADSAPLASAEMKMDKDAGGEVADGGGAAPEVMVRSEFADLLKWVGSVETDEKGEATIDLEMPDNLTTWKIKTWAMGHGTRVGEGSAEIVTSKDLIVRLQAPRFFVEKDEVTLSAVVHNYHKEAKDVKISLELDGDNLESSGANERRAVIEAGGETRIDWTAKALKEGEVTIRMKAIASDDSDAMEMSFPVFVHGILKTESYSRAIAPEGKVGVIEFTIPKERRPSETRVTINYSPSVASAMVDALPYLASYPYGCTEQTLNRFVPTTVVHNILKELGHDLSAIKDKRAQLNPQKIGDPKERAADWQPKGPHWNPVWDEKEVAKMEKAGIEKLREQQNPDGGWGWFSAFGSRSYPHTTSVVMHGLLLAKDNGATIPDDMIAKGLAWLAKHEETEADKIANWKKREKNTKQKADATDALVRRVLGEGGKNHAQMLGFLFRDKVDLPLYAKALVGLEFHRTKDFEKRDDLIRNIRQFMKTDEENQTAYLDLKNGNYWWYWYGSEFEAQAWFLKLLAAAEPESPDTRGLVKYLINNRSNATYWNSTRDTAYCLEAIGDYLKASGEGDPDLSVDVIYDGKKLKTVKITKENLFTFDSSAIIAGDVVTGGKHKVELRKTGKGPLYSNAYVEYFTLEDFITKAGLEVKVERSFYKLVEDTTVIDAVDSQGQAIDQKRARYKRVPLESGDEVKSGDLIEVELSVESKNDYEYLLFEDWKAAGMEAVEVRSGYNPNGLGAYMELRDEKVSLFVQNLPRGKHNLSYRLRAEIPGKFSALPTMAEAMYAPELRANSDEMKIEISDR